MTRLNRGRLLPSAGAVVGSATAAAAPSGQPGPAAPTTRQNRIPLYYFAHDLPVMRHFPLSYIATRAA